MRPRMPTRFEDDQKGKSKGKGKEGKSTYRKNPPKSDETKKKEVHFTNFTEQAAYKLMNFLFKIVHDNGLEDYLEEEDGVPILYTFGKELSKACVLRCTTEQKAKEIIKYLRAKGDILFGPPGLEKKIRVISGYDDRSDEHKMADFMMRKMRLALYGRKVPDALWFSEWKTWKMFFLPDGNMEHREEVATWCPTTWTYKFSASIIAEAPWWRTIREDWLYLIRPDPNRTRDEFEGGGPYEHGDYEQQEQEQEEDDEFRDLSLDVERRPGTDGHRSSSDREDFNPFARWH